MDMSILALLLIVPIGFLGYWAGRKSVSKTNTFQPEADDSASSDDVSEGESEDKITSEPASESNDTAATRSIMMNALTKIGCNPKVYDNGHIVVQYQGENFEIEFQGMCARIWDFNWLCIDVDSPDLPILRRAANAANFVCIPTIVMSEPDEDGMVGFASRSDLFIVPEHSDNAGYVAVNLYRFFVLKNQMRNYFNKFRFEQSEAKEPNSSNDLTTISEN